MTTHNHIPRCWIKISNRSRHIYLALPFIVWGNPNANSQLQMFILHYKWFLSFLASFLPKHSLDALVHPSSSRNFERNQVPTFRLEKSDCGIQTKFPINLKKTKLPNLILFSPKETQACGLIMWSGWRSFEIYIFVGIPTNESRFMKVLCGLLLNLRRTILHCMVWNLIVCKKSPRLDNKKQ